MEPDELERIYDETRNWGRWGPEDERGALNHLTPEKRRAARELPAEGIPLSLAHDLPVTPSGETPSPAHHHMLVAGDARDASGMPGYESALDYMGTEVHGLGITHVDALCHTFVRGEMYNGHPVSREYFGAYALDGLAIALWAVYHSNSATAAIAKAANVLGDADSTACIAGQLAGSFYGDASIDRRLLDMLRVWDPDREIEMRAALLFCAGQA